MPTFRGIVVVGLVSAAIVITVAARGSTAINGSAQSSGSQILTTAPATPTTLPPGEVVWGRVPDCSCFMNSATDSVAGALKKANPAVSLKELSPRDGWLYFAVVFDADSATSEQVRLSMAAGGAEILEGPP